jgi:hypothetical protein
MHARVALAEAEKKNPEERAALLAEVEREVRRIEREAMGWSDPLAALLRAAVASMRGDKKLAERGLSAAAAGFDEAKMKLFAVLTRRRLGALLGDAEGQKLRNDADAWFAQETVKRPEGFVAMLAPGFR